MDQDSNLPRDAKQISVCEYSMAYTDSGSGVPLVLLHGTLFDFRIWSLQKARLSSQWRVIAPSLRHFFPERWVGNSKSFSIEQHVSDVVALIVALKLKKVHLLGWSRGGCVAIEIAKRYPELIRTLILEDAVFPTPDIPVQPPQNGFSLEKLRQDFRISVEKGEFDYAVENFVDGMNTPGYWTDLRPEHKKIAFDNIYTVFGDLSRPSTSASDLAAFDFPIFLISGERSNPAFKARNEIIKTHCKNVSVAEVAGGGHLMHSESPDRFNQLIAGFILKN